MGKVFIFNPGDVQMENVFVFSPVEDLAQTLKQCMDHSIFVKLHEKDELGKEKIEIKSYYKLADCEIILDLNFQEMQIRLDGVPFSGKGRDEISFVTSSFDLLLPYGWWNFHIEKSYEHDGEIKYIWSDGYGPENTLTIQSPQLERNRER